MKYHPLSEIFVEAGADKDKFEDKAREWLKEKAGDSILFRGLLEIELQKDKTLEEKFDEAINKDKKYPAWVKSWIGTLAQIAEEHYKEKE